jgi:AcrR family transcriptional regulator
MLLLGATAEAQVHNIRRRCMPPRRPRQPRERQEDHPTRLQIIDVAATILKTAGVPGFHMDDVLAATGLTRGAVYHHFDNVDDLVESALLAVYAEGLSANIALVERLMASATTSAEFRAGVLRANEAYVYNVALRKVRTLRAHALGATAAGSRMADALGVAQQRLTDAYVAMITDAQRRGWVRPHLNPEALAVFVQAYSFGIIIDDVSERHLSPDSWAQLIADFFTHTVFTEVD